MKKTLVILFSVFLTGIGFYGCKKGEGDPMISFKSRDKRMMGEWTVSKIDESRVTVYKDNTVNATFYQHQTTSETKSFDGSTWSETVKKDYTGNPAPTTTSETETNVYTTTITLTLDKHGVAKSTETNSYRSTTLATSPVDTWAGCTPGQNCDGTYTYAGTALTNTNTYEGKWSWLGDNKNKEQILIDMAGTMGGIYMIEQLKNKEIILKKNLVDGYAYSGADNESENITETGTYTLTGK